MASYLLVDDINGSVLAELASAQQAVRVLGRLARSAQDPRVRVVRLAHQRGSLTDVASSVSMRPLRSLMDERPVNRGRHRQT